ncbi:acyl carrier protein [Campylobacter hominis]|uniref:HTH cro/C1-type domain-containing protein n=1 Tax=Campylobacter hominis (strain ATCC BAA-381 / DSM 21671 / CCUG 45161 / LMG 19568 / NCTC 13146 / CH001A) TaxID=360107 RepID=A7I3L9_CAMHC|nr:acyl carrier protein [Campylobacter hominis]ABS51466.1 conserved hypothetical protein [Campylobacter hominis ATCC BAA-381]UAK85678.1 helix-turn-helix transcriptional regulator [Campylobacter hominis]SUW85622.1 dihydroorotase (DHOase) [Campylobacter hominis]
MNKQEFQALLKKAGINKKELSEISGIPYPTVNAWGSRTPYPPYIDFLLKNYIKSKIYEDIKDRILEIEKISK